MKSKKYATIENGKIIQTWDSSEEDELNEHQIPLTTNEYWLLSAVGNDLDLAKSIIRDIEERINKLEA